MSRTVKDATVKTFHHEDLESLKAHVPGFVSAHNFAKHLKALKWKTPFQGICDAWKSNPAAFRINPHHLIPGSYRAATTVEGAGRGHGTLSAGEGNQP